MTFFFDARAVAAKIQNQQATPANPANLAKQDPKTEPHLADLAVLAAPTGQNPKSTKRAEAARIAPANAPNTAPTFRDNQKRADDGNQPQSLGPFPDRVGVGGRPVTWTGKVVSLDDWRNLSEWERHGPNGKHWNGNTQKWEKANEQ